jgi:hypothetical protein
VLLGTTGNINGLPRDGYRVGQMYDIPATIADYLVASRSLRCAAASDRDSPARNAEGSATPPTKIERQES